MTEAILSQDKSAPAISSLYTILTAKQMRTAKIQYRSQLSNAKVRNIEWDFTFETWLTLWLCSGKYFLRGCKMHQYCMARHGDKGPYSESNVSIITMLDNCKQIKTPSGADWHARHSKKRLTVKRIYAHIRKMRKKLPKLKCADCSKIFTPSREWQKFCSSQCRIDNGNRIRKEALVIMRKCALNAMKAEI